MTWPVFDDVEPAPLSGLTVSACGALPAAGPFLTKPRLAHTRPRPQARLVIDRPPPTRLMPTIKRIVEIGQLEQDWDSYGARAVELSAVTSAIGWLLGAMTETIPLPQVVPTVVGGIQFEWHEAKLDLELHFAPGGRVAAWLEDQQTGDEWEADVTQDAWPVINRLRLLTPSR